MNADTSQLDPNELITLLERQRGLYLNLRELSDKQRSMIAGDRPELLLQILRERQDLVGSLVRLNEQLAPFRRHWDATYAALPDDRRQQASTLLHEINGLLRVILRTDQEDGALLAARKQAVAADLAATTGGRVANAAYARHAAGRAGPAAADMTG
jgi:hypothetical protein